ncbi:WcaI family glycosyltransferase [Rhizobium puerariae]|uniref:WcaI family glycosyltransferase n=1 Tax=Rhizobium puerariae TaxID=1585791 RepID=A0ABV6AI26_9HYPH
MTTQLAVEATERESAPEDRTAASVRTRVVVYGMNYAPELAGVGRYTGEIAEHLAQTGVDVSVVTTPPHYPGWKVSGSFRNRYSSGVENGVKVLRTPLLLRQKMGGIWRLIAPLSFALTSAPVIFWEIVRRRPHAVVCVEPTLFASPVALVAAKIVGARTVLHVQDLEVDAAFAVGHLGKSKLLSGLAFGFERTVLKGFNSIITISERMCEKLEEKGLSRSKLQVLRNWVDIDHIYPLEQVSPYRDELGYGPEDFIVLYSGNIGAKQGLNILLDAAEALEKVHSHVKFVVAGDGPVKAGLEKRYGQLANVRFLPFQPYARLNEFLNMADLHALPQEKGAADLVLPSKLGGMLASGKQILVTADEGTELAEFLAGSALLVPPGDPALLAQGVARVASGEIADRRDQRLGLSRRLSKAIGIAEFAAVVASPGLSSRTRRRRVSG